MKKLIITTFIALLFSLTALSGYNGTVMSATQSESEISKSRDLCGGTRGNGEIVSVGSDTFTLTLNDRGQKGGDNLIVTLTRRATIETPTGFVSLSDLKIGDRVTLVGDNNRDGTFTADAVVVCSKTRQVENPENGTDLTNSPQAGQVNPIAVRNKNNEAYEKVSGAMNIATILLVSLIGLGIGMFLRLKKKKSFVYLLFFTIFYIYVYKVLDYTLLQFQSLLLLQHFVPNLILNGFRDGTNVNLIPLVTLKLEDAITSLLNILMMMPFGFGLPFITDFRMKNVVISGLLLSIVIEFLQLVTGFLGNTTFRVADINDLIFNTLGVLIGYILFVGFVRNCRHLLRNRRMSIHPILRYISERPQVDKQLANPFSP